MSDSSSQPELLAISQRMERQRQLLRQQFAPPPALAVSASDSSASRRMQPFQPRSVLMRLLLLYPRLITRLLTFAITGAVGARSAPWLLRAFALWNALRQSRR